MGLFDMFKKDSKKDDGKVNFILPVSGEVVKIEEVPDDVFSSKMMGDGFAIKPTGNKIYAPVSGEIASIFPTNHAVGLKTPEGVEVLIHVGIDTVNLKGEGFTAHVKAGDKINAGDLLLDVDFDSIETKVPSIITPIIFTNLNGYEFKVNYGSKNEKDSEVVEIGKGA